jgi:hypothetical protein
MSTRDHAPVTAEMTAVTAHSTAAPAPRPASACPVALRAVVSPTRRRSQRPASSSPRRRRALVSRPQTAPMIISVMEDLNTVNPPTV